MLLGCLSVPLLAANPSLTEKKFKEDLSYYRNTAKAQNLNANDRLYILDRLRQKYRDSEFDLTELYREIDRWYGKKTEGGTGEQKPGSLPSPTGPKSLKEVTVSEGPNTSKILFKTDGTPLYKDVLRKDPKGLQMPVLSLYLYNTRIRLSKTSKNFRVGKGFIRQVQSKLISRSPPTIKISVAFREDHPYQIVQSGDQIVLTVSKNEIPSPVQGAGNVPAVAVAAAPTLLASTQTESSEPAPESAVPALTSSTTIEVGDLLEVQISGPVELNHEALVGPNGMASIPILGEIQAARRSAPELEMEMAQKLSELIPNPRVKITVQKFSSDQVFLTGLVKASGIYRLKPNLKCFELITKAGGLIEGADKRNIKIYRLDGEKRTAQIFNAEEYLKQEDPSKDLLLQSGDLIEVPRMNHYVFVMGAVKSQGRYEFKEGSKMMQVIYQAGGLEGRANLDQVRIIRSENDKKISLEVDLRQILKGNPDQDPVVREGDMILIPEKKSQVPKFFSNRVLPWATFITSLGLVLAFLIK